MDSYETNLMRIVCVYVQMCIGFILDTNTECRETSPCIIVLTTIYYSLVLRTRKIHTMSSWFDSDLDPYKDLCRVHCKTRLLDGKDECLAWIVFQGIIKTSLLWTDMGSYDHTHTHIINIHGGIHALRSCSDSDIGL